MSQLLPSTTLSVAIDRPVQAVYAFAANPRNLPLWAPGFALAVAPSGDSWQVTTAGGPVSLRFAEPNAFGVLDHDVRLPTGQLFHNPMRVIPNGAGSLVLFTLFQAPGVSDEAFAADVRLVEQDLHSLKGLLEVGVGR